MGLYRIKLFYMEQSGFSLLRDAGNGNARNPGIDGTEMIPPA
jgi:hypothetical protein